MRSAVRTLLSKEGGFEEVKAAMKPGVNVAPFQHYFQFVLEQCKKLEAFWDVEPPASNV